MALETMYLIVMKYYQLTTKPTLLCHLNITGHYDTPYDTFVVCTTSSTNIYKNKTC